MSDTLEIQSTDYVIRLRTSHEYRRNPAPRIYIADEVAEARSADLADLVQAEKNLGDKRFSERGDHPAVDNLYDRLNETIADVKTGIAQDVLNQLAGQVAGDVGTAVSRAFFDRHAGCETCSCSPGVVAGTKLTWQGAEFDVWVETR